MKKRLLVCACALVMTACDASPDKPSPEPTTYAIRKADLWLETPTDICRYRSPSFLTDLLDRVAKRLPEKASPTVLFEDFNVTDPSPTGDRSAVLRLRADYPERGNVLVVASGDFDTTNCGIENIRGGVGASPLDLAEGTEFQVD